MRAISIIHDTSLKNKRRLIQLNDDWVYDPSNKAEGLLMFVCTYKNSNTMFLSLYLLTNMVKVQVYPAKPAWNESLFLEA